MSKKILITFFLLLISFNSFSQSHAWNKKRSNDSSPNSEVYFFRENGLTGCLVRYKTFLDGKYIGKLGMQGYLKDMVTPGLHTVTVQMYEKTLQTDFYVKPYHAYYFKLAQNVQHVGKDLAVMAMGTVSGATTGVAFAPSPQISSRIILVSSKRI